MLAPGYGRMHFRDQRHLNVDRMPGDTKVCLHVPTLYFAFFTLFIRLLWCSYRWHALISTLLGWHPSSTPL